MFTQKEKDRRVAAAEKRLDDAQKRAETHQERLVKAKADAEKERKGLDWLREAPVTDEDPEPEPITETEPEGESAPRVFGA